MENVNAVVVQYGRRIIQTEKPVRGVQQFRACDDLPDSLRQDNLPVTISGYFKEACRDQDSDQYLPNPVTITKATIRQ
ncbi:MAG: hypothetical protein INR69_07620 [Mucilaginibacter polytrichastri]|nr:hypothetical protein [Mucilaginibacter polytrichastri]